MSQQLWGWLGGVAVSLALAAGTGWLFNGQGAAGALLAALFPAALAVAAIVVAANRRTDALQGLIEALAAMASRLSLRMPSRPKKRASGASGSTRPAPTRLA